MKLNEFTNLDENSFDRMAGDLLRMGEPKTPAGGRWPEGSKIEKDKEAKLNAMHGKTEVSPGKVKHKAGYNYSGRGYSSKHDSTGRGVNKDPHLALPSGGRMGGSFDSRTFREATGDKKFDDMMSGITGSDTPSVDLGNRQTVPDRQIMELTHKIFLRLREYDDPEIYQKFIEFMVKTINANVGPLDESIIRNLINRE